MKMHVPVKTVHGNTRVQNQGRYLRSCFRSKNDGYRQDSTGPQPRTSPRPGQSWTYCYDVKQIRHVISLTRNDHGNSPSSWARMKVCVEACSGPCLKSSSMSRTLASSVLQKDFSMVNALWTWQNVYLLSLTTVKSWTTTTITAGSSFSTYRARFQHLIFGLNFDSAVQKIRNFQTIGRRGEGHATGVTLTLRVTGQLRLSDRIIRLIRCTWPNDAKIIANCARRIGSAQSLFESMECHSFVPDRCSIMIGLIKASADWGPTVWPEERPGTTSSSCESFDSKVSHGPNILVPLEA
ncbi:unnamed protein product [Nesidiocoris tenuis]|uniref:Uncharacterized protein n=1 Tax=Nesidiocoris tenuis TaxID=355587 RepID=A0A6H5HQ33_9HEMI|nr:unnamed protein product [Nesidiocoris tenuis]